LTTLPEAIARLQNLTNLNLSDNELRTLPEAIAHLQNLTNLNLSDNELTELSDTFAKLQDLLVLDLGLNNLNYISEDITNLKKLKYLDLDDNSFSEIPVSIYRLQSLEKLSIKNGKTRLIRQGTKGKERKYRYNYNSIKKISSDILQLTSLRQLDLGSNPIETPPLEVVERGIEAIKNYFRL
jgi:Leucine-rich repeat (LRR) protein